LTDFSAEVKTSALFFARIPFPGPSFRPFFGHGQRMSQRFWQTVGMKKNRRRINYIGKNARVRSCFDGYSLPDGLPEGATVRIVGFDFGHFEVEYEGHAFRVSMTCVENLHQLWV
jgi:hypothetical protein